MLRACSLILCLCFALAAPATVFADASARVLSVTPGVRYSLGSADEALAVKMDVPVKAVVMSDATGKAQLMFPDDSTLSIAPDTRISLAEYVDTEQEENIVLDLVSGTARIITGESNRKNPQAFTVNTPQASIGIRGTLVTIQAGGGVTRVYLTETSGKGVSVRNLGTGQVMELRKPGTIINVGANFMEERKAQKEEAANFSAALRGKSRAELHAATARAEEELRRAAVTNLAPEGSLPRVGAADPVQLTALTAADRLDHASLVASVPGVPEIPELSGSGVAAIPGMGPNVDVEHYEITDISLFVDASFSGKGYFDFSRLDMPDWNLATTATIRFMLPPSKSGFIAEGNSYSALARTVNNYQLHGNLYNLWITQRSTSRYRMNINIDGSFTYKAGDTGFISFDGRFTSPTTAIITKYTSTYTESSRVTKSVLKEPATIYRVN